MPHVSDPRDFDADLITPRLLSFLLGTETAPGGRSNGGFNFPVTLTWLGPLDLSYNRAQKAPPKHSLQKAHATSDSYAPE